MGKFILKGHNNAFGLYHIINGVKEYYSGLYSNINILDAIRIGTYNRRFENIISIPENKNIPISTDSKEWDDFTDKQLLEVRERLEKIKGEMSQKGIDINEKLQVLAYLYQVFQKEVKYYDMVNRAQFPLFDDIDLLYENDTLYAGLVKNYASSKGICEMMKLSCNYFDIACDVVETRIPKPHFINRIYLENNNISYISLADEIGLVDGYYTFEDIKSRKRTTSKLKMVKRRQPRTKEVITYFFFLADRNIMEETHKNIKGLVKSVAMSATSKRQLFQSINNRSEKQMETKKEKNKYLLKNIYASIAAISLFIANTFINLFTFSPKTERVSKEKKETKALKVDMVEKEKRKGKKQRDRSLVVENTINSIKVFIASKISDYSKKKISKKEEKRLHNLEVARIKREIKDAENLRRIEQKRLRKQVIEARKYVRQVKRKQRLDFIKKVTVATILVIPVTFLKAIRIVQMSLSKIASFTMEKTNKIKGNVANSFSQVLERSQKTEKSASPIIKTEIKEQNVVIRTEIRKPGLKPLTGEVNIMKLKVETLEVEKKEKAQDKLRLREQAFTILRNNITLVREVIGKMKKAREERVFDYSIEQAVLVTGDSKRKIKTI